MKPRLVAELLEQVARLAYRSKHTQTLTAEQWATLRYLAKTFRPRTIESTAVFLGIGAEEASVAASELCRDDLVAMNPPNAHSTEISVAITQKGRDLLVYDPVRKLETAIENLAEAERAGMAQSLERLLSRLTAASAT